MDETIKAIDNHIADCDDNARRVEDPRIAATLAQAKSIALLAKAIAAGIKMAEENE